MLERIIDRVAFKQIAEPKNGKGATIVGAPINVSEGHSVFSLFSFTETLNDASAPVDGVVTINFKQTDGSTTKDLTVNGHYFHKASNATKFSKVAFESNTITVDELKQLAGILYIEIPVEFLDSNNGFNQVVIEVADTSENKTVAGIYGLHFVRNGFGYEVNL